VRALTLTATACVVLLLSKQLSLALNVAVFALILLYFMHSLIFLMLPSRNPQLNSEITIGLPVRLQRGAALLSVLAMGGLIVVQVIQDLITLGSTTLNERIWKHSLTSLELIVVWSAIGALLYVLLRRRQSSG
jgi:hypothetical protein